MDKGRPMGRPPPKKPLPGPPIGVAPARPRPSKSPKVGGFVKKGGKKFCKRPLPKKGLRAKKQPSPGKKQALRQLPLKAKKGVAVTGRPLPTPVRRVIHDGGTRSDVEARIRAHYAEKIRRKTAEEEALLRREFEMKVEEARLRIAARYEERMTVELQGLDLSSAVAAPRRHSNRDLLVSVYSHNKSRPIGKTGFAAVTRAEDGSLLVAEGSPIQVQEDATIAASGPDVQEPIPATMNQDGAPSSSPPVADGDGEEVVRSWQQITSLMDAAQVEQHTSECIIRAQAVMRRWLARRVYKGLLKRKNLVEELVATERTYVDALSVLREEFQIPLLQQASTMKVSSGDVWVVFGNLSEIIRLQRTFLAELEPFVNPWKDEVALGTFLASFVPRFGPPYTAYLGSYEGALRKLSLLSHNSVWCDTLHRLEASRGDGSSRLHDFLIRPVQRLPRYEMLIMDLSRYTPTHHPDYDGLRSALEAVKGVAQDVNDSSEDAIECFRLMDLRQRVIGLGDFELVQPFRKVYKEGDIVDVSTDARKSRSLILLSDALLWGKPTAHRKGRGVALTSIRRVTMFSDVAGVNNSCLGEEDVILVRLKDGSVLGVMASSRKDHSAWHRLITLALERYESETAVTVRTVMGHRTTVMDELRKALTFSVGQEYLQWLSEELEQQRERKRLEAEVDQVQKEKAPQIRAKLDNVFFGMMSRRLAMQSSSTNASTDPNHEGGVSVMGHSAPLAFMRRKGQVAPPSLTEPLPARAWLKAKEDISPRTNHHTGGESPAASPDGTGAPSTATIGASPTSAPPLPPKPAQSPLIGSKANGGFQVKPTDKPGGGGGMDGDAPLLSDSDDASSSEEGGRRRSIIGRLRPRKGPRHSTREANVKGHEGKRLFRRKVKSVSVAALDDPVGPMHSNLTRRSPAQIETAAHDMYASWQELADASERSMRVADLQSRRAHASTKLQKCHEAMAQVASMAGQAPDDPKFESSRKAAQAQLGTLGQELVEHKAELATLELALQHIGESRCFDEHGDVAHADTTNGAEDGAYVGPDGLPVMAAASDDFSPTLDTQVSLRAGNSVRLLEPWPEEAGWVYAQVWSDVGTDSVVGYVPSTFLTLV